MNNNTYNVYFESYASCDCEPELVDPYPDLESAWKYAEDSLQRNYECSLELGYQDTIKPSEYLRLESIDKIHRNDTHIIFDRPREEMIKENTIYMIVMDPEYSLYLIRGDPEHVEEHFDVIVQEYRNRKKEAYRNNEDRPSKNRIGKYERNDLY